MIQLVGLKVDGGVWGGDWHHGGQNHGLVQVNNQVISLYTDSDRRGDLRQMSSRQKVGPVQ